MTPLLLFHAPDAEALLRHAAAPLLGARTGEPTPLLAVRQGGIRDDVLALAAQAGCAGWLGEPLVVFRELLALLAGDVEPLTSFEREALLRRVLREQRLDGLRELRDVRGFLVAVDDLVGDLHAGRARPDAVERALEDARRGGDWEAARDRELVSIYRGWGAAVAALPPRHGRRRIDGRDLPAVAAEAVRSDPTAVRRRLRRPFGPAEERRPLDLYGLADLAGGWDDLLDALVEGDVFAEVRVHLLTAPAEPTVEPLSEGRVLDRLARSAQASTTLPPSPRPAVLARVRDELFTAPAPAGAEGPGTAGAEAAPREPGLPAASPLSFAAAPDLGRELARVARRAKRLIVEEGVDPSAIAVVVRGLRPEGPRAVRELQRHGVPVTARLRYRLTEIPAIAALLRLFRLAAEGWSRSALIELAESPYFDLWLDPGVLGWVSSRARPASLPEWSAELERARAAAAAAEADPELEYRGPSEARIRVAAERFDAFAARARRLEASRPRADWLDLALEVLGAGALPGEVRPGLWDFAWRAGRPPAAPGMDPDPLRVEAARLDSRALAAARDAVAAWKDALLLDPDGNRDLDAEDWLEEVTAAFAEGELAAWTPHRHGVQVLEALAAVGRTFEHLFVVGLSAADFPSEPPRQPLLAEAEVERLRAGGLPLEPADEWRAREASLFRSVVTAARRTLDLGYTYADAAGAAVLASQYLEEVAALFDPDEPESLLERIPGSRLLPEEAGQLWAPEDALLFGARAWSAARPSGGDVARSSLAEAARVAPAPVARALHGARVEHLRDLGRGGAGRDGRLHAYNGEVRDPALLAWLSERYAQTVWSASRLETYGFCPFRFFGTQVLRLAPLREAEEDMDAATRGTVMHAALERLHRELVERHGLGALKSEHLEEAAELLAEIVPAVIEAEAARGWLGADELRGVAEEGIRRSLVRYVRWEMEENEKDRYDRPPRVPVEFEWRFGDGVNRPEAELWQGERMLRLRGRIDRVDEVAEGPGRGRRYIVDHKSGAAAFDKLTNKRDAGALLQLELYVHALTAHGDDGEGMWGGAYQIINEPGRKAPLHLYSIAAGRLKDDNKTQADARARLDGALTRALDHVDAVVGGRFPATIPDGCECPFYCELREVCREDHLGRREP